MSDVSSSDGIAVSQSPLTDKALAEVLRLGLENNDLRAELKAHKKALEECVVALESALAGVWDGHYSRRGVTTEYAQAVDAEVKSAIAKARQLTHLSSSKAPCG